MGCPEERILEDLRKYAAKGDNVSQHEDDMHHTAVASWIALIVISVLAQIFNWMGVI